MPPAYSVEVQAKIPAALCAIHNFIWQFDPSEGQVPADNIGSFGYGNRNEDIGGNNDRSDARREKIAEDMWRDYQEILAERGMVDNTDEDSQEESFSSDEWDEEDEGH